MTMAALDKRKYLRVAAAPPSSMPGEIQSGHPFIVDVSRGGACLWLSHAPRREQGLALRFRQDGQDCVLLSRLVWLRQRLAASNGENPPGADGWLAGFAFAEENANTLTADVPHDIMRASDITVDFLAENDAADNSQKETAGGKDAPGEVVLQSIPRFKAAVSDLLPVFATHFSEIRLIFEPNRLEVSASLRPPAVLNPPDARRRRYRTIQPSQAASAPVPVRVAPPVAQLQPERTRALDGRRLGLIAVASLAALILGWNVVGVLHKSNDTPAALKGSVERRSVPAWALGLDQSSLDGWVEIQKRFNLPDATVRSAIQILRNNDKYPSAHDLHDLTRYPVQVRRSFLLLAGPQTGTRFDLGALKNELEGRMVAGTRFPDESPGGRYSGLQLELYNNNVVLSVIDLLYRRQDDPGVKDILAALKRSRA